MTVMTPTLAFLENVGPLELIVILAVAVLLFGGSLPSVAHSVGKALAEFKRGVRETSDEVRREMDREAERTEGRSVAPVGEQAGTGTIPQARPAESLPVPPPEKELVEQQRAAEKSDREEDAKKEDAAKKEDVGEEQGPKTEV